jgi:hypothetical protein
VLDGFYYAESIWLGREAIRTILVLTHDTLFGIEEHILSQSNVWFQGCSESLWMSCMVKSELYFPNIFREIKVLPETVGGPVAKVFLCCHFAL